MTDVEHGALWANDLRRLRRPEMRCDGYVPVEIQAGWLIDELAKSSGVGRRRSASISLSVVVPSASGPSRRMSSRPGCG